MSDLSGWLTLAEAAGRYGVKRDRLRRATLEGRLRGHKVGAGSRMPWLVQPGEVERFLRDTRKGPKPKRARREDFRAHDAKSSAGAAPGDRRFTGAGRASAVGALNESDREHQ